MIVEKQQWVRHARKAIAVREEEMTRFDNRSRILLANEGYPIARITSDNGCIELEGKASKAGSRQQREPGGIAE
jgi:hypothetical protein